MAEEKKQEQKKQEKKLEQAKKEKKVEKPIKEDLHESLIRIYSYDIPGSKQLYPGLTRIKGVSWTISNAICLISKISRNKRISELSKDEIKQIETLLKRIGCVLVIDECYFELGGITAASLIESCPNVIILRSFSKVFAMAGARLGYILCNQEVAKYLNTLQMSNQPFSVNRFAQAAAVAILSQPLLIEKSVSRFLQLKKGFENKLNEVAELEVLETKTSFSLVKVASSITGAQLKEKLKD